MSDTADRITIGTTAAAGEGDPADRLLEVVAAEHSADGWAIVTRDGAGEVIGQRYPAPGEIEAILNPTAEIGPTPEEVAASLASAEQRIAELEAQIAAILAALGQS